VISVGGPQPLTEYVELEELDELVYDEHSTSLS